MKKMTKNEQEIVKFVLDDFTSRQQARKKIGRAHV